ncbi:imelysin family protein [Leptospira perolatii]|uniref:imelysin family protein n=1 Tax=Leptospira perolatii TaxID=2023191 RepID=UPI0013FD4CC9|nr:imelysin family protein [Leptospira perolatii]
MNRRIFGSKKLVLLAALTLFAVGSCSPKNAEATNESSMNGFLYRMFNSFDPTKFLENMGSNVIPALFQNVATQAGELTVAAANLCGSTSLAQFQTEWKENVSALKKVELIQFGPGSISGYSPLMDFWPLNYETSPPTSADRTALDAITGASPNVSGLPAGQRGLPAIEYLIFTAPSPCSSSDRLELVKSLAADYNSNSQALFNAWKAGGGNFGGQLASAGQGSEVFLTKASAFDLILSNTIDLIHSMKDAKLEFPSDLMAGGTGLSPDPNKAESRFAGPTQSFQNVKDNVESFKSVYFGNGGAGLSDYVAFVNPNIDQEVRAELLELEATLNLLTNFDSGNMTNLKKAVLELDEIEKLLTTELAAALGTSPVTGGKGGDGD